MDKPSKPDMPTQKPAETPDASTVDPLTGLPRPPKPATQEGTAEPGPKIGNPTPPNPGIGNPDPPDPGIGNPDPPNPG